MYPIDCTIDYISPTLCHCVGADIDEPIGKIGILEIKLYFYNRHGVQFFCDCVSDKSFSEVVFSVAAAIYFRQSTKTYAPNNVPTVNCANAFTPVVLVVRKRPMMCKRCFYSHCGNHVSSVFRTNPLKTNTRSTVLAIIFVI